MEASEWVLVIAALLGGGGGLTALLRTRSEAPKMAAEAQSTVISNLQHENERYLTRIQVLEERDMARSAEIAACKVRLQELEVKIKKLDSP